MCHGLFEHPRPARPPRVMAPGPAALPQECRRRTGERCAYAPHAALSQDGSGRLGQDAPELRSLRAGDVLDNASRAAVRAHATLPTALAHYVDAGLLVLSSPNLHAHVIATSQRALIVTTNPSHRPTCCRSLPRRPIASRTVYRPAGSRPPESGSERR